MVVFSNRKVLARVDALGVCLLACECSNNRASVTSCQPSAAAGKHGNADLLTLIDNESDPLFAAGYDQ